MVTSMMHRIQCKCGSVVGHVEGKGIHNRVVCYCADCQAFARYLGCADEVLDAQGGTDIVQLAQPRVTFSQGREQLAAIRLGENGLLRWYAACCNTPLGNTLPNPKISFIGLVHSSLDHSMIDADFGESAATVHVDSASGEPKPKANGLVGAGLRFLWIVASTRIGKRYRGSELFDESGAPIVRPVVLTSQEVDELKRSGREAYQKM